MYNVVICSGLLIGSPTSTLALSIFYSLSQGNQFQETHQTVSHLLKISQCLPLLLPFKQNLKNLFLVYWDLFVPQTC